ncbi:hypothetical protein MMC19_002832 [Ptychographa xylographoides]|nr:hypothetical protein [Ptychographa xylographoides]
MPQFASARSENRSSQNENEWSQAHELYQPDIRTLDLGLFEDKLERAVRTAYTEYLLLDAKMKRVILVLPTILPHQIIGTVLGVFFGHCGVPGVTMLPVATMAVVAAGVRAGVVVDIGWGESVATGVYEFREVWEGRTTRGVRAAVAGIAKVLSEAAKGKVVEKDGDEGTGIDVDFEHAEEVLKRMGWCRPRERLSALGGDVEDRSENTNLRSESSSSRPNSQPRYDDDLFVSVPILSPFSEPTKIAFSAFSQPIEAALIAPSSDPHNLDDHEQSLPHLLYKALLSLPPDVRGNCMSRIIFTGGGSHIPGLKARIIDDLRFIVADRGWDPVYGRAADIYRMRVTEGRRKKDPHLPKREQRTQTTENTIDSSTQSPHLAPTGLEPQIPDPIAEKLHHEDAKVNPHTMSGHIRSIETLGAWAGASLVASMKIKGIVEIEREAFLQQGMAGAKREGDVSVVQPGRQSLGPSIGIGKGGGMERGAWTLGGWA